MNHLVFVYGTLKHGAWNNRLLDGSELLGSATTRQHYTMAGCDGMVPRVFDLPGHDAAAPVRGEVWRVNDATLAELDRLEGHPNAYQRSPVEIVCHDGSRTIAWLYFYNRMSTWFGMRAPIDSLHNWQPKESA